MFETAFHDRVIKTDVMAKPIKQTPILTNADGINFFQKKRLVTVKDNRKNSSFKPISLTDVIKTKEQGEEFMKRLRSL